jgi:UDP-N-acetyl-D-glucosamine dehydrogenase
MDLLKGQGAQVGYYDPHVPVIRMTREHPHWAGLKSAAWNRETIGGFDVALISTAHKAIAWQELADWAQCIVDTRNVMAPYAQSHPGKIWKA